MGIIAWILLGLIAGILANLADPRPHKGGILSALILGIVGAFIGGFLASIFLGVGITGLNVWSILISAGGAILLLLLSRFMQSSY